MNAGRKLKQKRKSSKRADKKKNKASFGIATLGKGVVTNVIGISAKSPNYGVRRSVNIELKTGGSVTAVIPGDGGLNYISENVSENRHTHVLHYRRLKYEQDTVLFQKYKRALRDIRPVKYKVIGVNGCPLKNLMH